MVVGRKPFGQKHSPHSGVLLRPGRVACYSGVAGSLRRYGHAVFLGYICVAGRCAVHRQQSRVAGFRGLRPRLASWAPAYTRRGLTQLLALMTSIKELLLSSTLFLTTCASTSPASAEPIRTVRAVELANAAAPQRVPGTFLVNVKATDAKSDVTYLSSELDYKDQRNLAIVISANAVEQLEQRLGAPPGDALRGRQILVTGEAERVTIQFYWEGMPMKGYYYYQTQVKVSNADQIEIAGDAD